MNLRACVIALLLGLSGPVQSVSLAHAQGADKSDPFTDMARQRFQEGVKLFDARRFEESRGAFLQAYALKKHPAVLLNLALSELRSNHPVDAARHFAQYLQENPSATPAERKTAEQGLSEARAKTGRVKIDVSVAGADVFVDEELIGKSPLRDDVDVGPGTHKIEARLSGHPNAAGQVSVSAGQLTAIELKMDRGGSLAAVAGPVDSRAVGQPPVQCGPSDLILDNPASTREQSDNLQCNLEHLLGQVRSAILRSHSLVRQGHPTVQTLGCRQRIAKVSFLGLEVTESRGSQADSRLLGWV